jgi:hypothetical protein
MSMEEYIQSAADLKRSLDIYELLRANDSAPSHIDDHFMKRWCESLAETYRKIERHCSKSENS